LIHFKIKSFHASFLSKNNLIAGSSKINEINIILVAINPYISLIKFFDCFKKIRNKNIDNAYELE